MFFDGLFEEFVEDLNFEESRVPLVHGAPVVMRADVFDIQVCVASVGDIDGAFPQITTVTDAVLVPDILVYEVRCVKGKP